MATIDPALEPVLSALVRGLRELGVPFCVVGALVPQLLLDTKPTSRTNDADVVVFVPDVAAFDAVKRGLAVSKFSETTISHRLRYAPGGLVDLLPYSHDLAPDGMLRLPPDLILNMAGFDWSPSRSEAHRTASSGRATMWCERGASGPVACVFLSVTQPVTRDGEFV